MRCQSCFGRCSCHLRKEYDVLMTEMDMVMAKMLMSRRAVLGNVFVLRDHGRMKEDANV